VRGPRGQKPWVSSFFALQAAFLTIGTHDPYQGCRKGVAYLGVLHHPTNFQAKILTGNFCL